MPMYRNRPVDQTRSRARALGVLVAIKEMKMPTLHTRKLPCYGTLRYTSNVAEKRLAQGCLRLTNLPGHPVQVPGYPGSRVPGYPGVPGTRYPGTPGVPGFANLGEDSADDCVRPGINGYPGTRVGIPTGYFK
eukprot:1568805-Rhodomonas_salina.1